MKTIRILQPERLERNAQEYSSVRTFRNFRGLLHFNSATHFDQLAPAAGL